MSSKSKNKRTVYYIVLFPLFAAIMFVSDIMLDIAMNVHLLAMFITVFTSVYRAKALIPIYLYVFLNGLYYGFNGWWIGYLYVWAVLWGAVMLLPRNLKPRSAAIIYSIVAGAHGLLFGTMLAPVNAVMAGFDFKQTIAWIIAGLFPADLIHCISNVTVTFLLSIPMITVLKKAEARIVR